MNATSRNRLKWAGVAFAATLSISAFAGCQLINEILGSDGSTPASSSFALTVTSTVNGTTTTYGPSFPPYDFGAVDPGSSAGKSVSFNLKNTGQDTVTISSVGVDHPVDPVGYAFTLSDTTIAAGRTVTLTGKFTPQSNKPYDANVMINGSSGGDSGTLTFPVTGQGNYPPVITFRIEVTASLNSTYNGTYVWDESKSAYVNNNNNSYSMYRADSGDWILGTDVGGARTIDSSVRSWDALPPMGAAPHDTWNDGMITVLDDSAGGVYDGSTYDAPPYSSGGLKVVPIANIQSDAEHDAVGTSLYQWQKATVLGSWTDVSGATGRILSLTTKDTWYRVVITPVAQAGVKAGTPVKSPPVYVQQQPAQ
jgi:hypothetical protein